MDDVRAAYLRDLASTFRYHKSLADRALAQVADDDLHTLVDREANSIAIIIKHVAGNLRSRYTDFLTSDGEKPDRNRDGEFEMPERASRTELLAAWDRAFGLVLDTIAALQPEDLGADGLTCGRNRSRRRSAEPLGDAHGLSRRPDRAAGEAFLRGGWTTLTIPKGKSAEHEIPYKARLQMRPGGYGGCRSFCWRLGFDTHQLFREPAAGLTRTLDCPNPRPEKPPFAAQTRRQ